MCPWGRISVSGTQSGIISAGFLLHAVFIFSSTSPCLPVLDGNKTVRLGPAKGDLQQNFYCFHTRLIVKIPQTDDI